AKAREIQRETAALKFREIEQAVFATFLHSQPIGQKAMTRDLSVMLGHTHPDKIELEKGLRQWAEVSWFLDEAGVQDAEVELDGTKQVPKSWRLGSKPNLRQMHHDACTHVSSELIEARLLDEISKLKSLTTGASAAGARVHNLPARPRDIEDDGEFHYAVLGPKAVSDSGRPSAEARRFLDETTASDRPRVYRNAVVLAVPSRDGLEAARNQIREYIGWEEVRSQLKDQEIDPIRSETLNANLEKARKDIPGVIRQAYSIVVTVSEKNDVQAFKINVSGEPLFNSIKGESRSRIQETPISADALLPEGPYDLWREGETSRRLKDLVGAFAQFTHLPKMLNRKAILDTLVEGCREGLFVLRLTRPDRSVRMWWREVPEENALKDPGLEVVLSEKATITELSSELLVPGILLGLWETPEITLKDLCEYFSGGRVVKIKREGYEEPLTIPKADRDVVEAAVYAVVKDGKLWLTSGPASILNEEIPAGLLTDDARLQAPPQSIFIMDLLPEKLPEAWSGETTTALAVSVAFSRRAGKTLPWATVREAIDGAFRARRLEPTLDSGPWPCDYTGAQNVKLHVPTKEPPHVAEAPLPEPGVLVAEADLRLNEIQDLADQVADIIKAAVGLDLKFHLRIELGGSSRLSDDVISRINKVLQEISEQLKLR
ncbi:MAG: hypothetical protein HY731_15440, partial [Candidatus Tectomicrobia bacterium]|nr:hypothetical protein [Candidatus Tectomicrobia bacterium]